MKTLSSFSVQTHILRFDSGPFALLHGYAFQTEVQSGTSDLLVDFYALVDAFELACIHVLLLLLGGGGVVDDDFGQVVEDFLDQFGGDVLGQGRGTVEQSMEGEELISMSHTLQFSSIMKSYPNSQWVFFRFSMPSSAHSIDCLTIYFICGFIF